MAEVNGKCFTVQVDSEVVTVRSQSLSLIQRTRFGSPQMVVTEQRNYLLLASTLPSCVPPEFSVAQPLEFRIEAWNEILNWNGGLAPTCKPEIADLDGMAVSGLLCQSQAAWRKQE